MSRSIGAQLLPLAWALLTACGVWAQADAPTPPLNLKQAFEAAWSRQPEALAHAARREAAIAARRAASGWTVEPAALELMAKTDRANGNAGAREYDVGVALPLWLPGERDRAGRLADAELDAAEARWLGARLRTAAQVRDAWWAWHRASLEHALSRERLAAARSLAADVERRVRAGDLARADQYQADGAVAQARSALADATATQSAVQLALRALLGTEGLALPHDAAEPLPPDAAATHPALVELLARAEVGRRAAELAAVQKRGNPELTIGTVRERSAFGEPYQGSLTVGIRVPFGGGSRSDAKLAAARADALEAEGLAALERRRLQADVEAARQRLDAARAQLDAAEQRTSLAREVRGFFEKSFRLGESDLPTRLRVELEAIEAERQAARARLDVAAAISTWRQALGLLPE